MNNANKTTFFMNNIYCFRLDIKKILFSIVGDNDLADDLTQNVLEKAWRGLDTLENREEPFVWIKGIIRNEIRAYFKKKSKIQESPKDNENIKLISDNNIEYIEKDILEGLLEKDRRKYIIQALEMLDDRSKVIVSLHLVVELPLKQIAEDLNLNYGSTRVFYSRAINKLRDLFLDIERGVI